MTEKFNVLKANHRFLHHNNQSINESIKAEVSSSSSWTQWTFTRTLEHQWENLKELLHVSRETGRYNVSCDIIHMATSL